MHKQLSGSQLGFKRVHLHSEIFKQNQWILFSCTFERSAINGGSCYCLNGFTLVRRIKYFVYMRSEQVYIWRDVYNMCVRFIFREEMMHILLQLTLPRVLVTKPIRSIINYPMNANALHCTPASYLLQVFVLASMELQFKETHVFASTTFCNSNKPYSCYCSSSIRSGDNQDQCVRSGTD
ncbi:Hypothetical_protein [Hexamita inflata]|uniref:Hypothetical_protein n=1 Tax=Hexamita inflata TaxID=28002 RepID=A0AA86RHW8_9EUKA|nr:Hypothetical protein HINF_LOCUS61418 [Hexamita inflata]